MLYGKGLPCIVHVLRRHNSPPPADAAPRVRGGDWLRRWVRPHAARASCCLATASLLLTCGDGGLGFVRGCCLQPERVNGQNYSVNSDVWSLGISMIELATGTFPIPQQGESLPIVAARTPDDPVPEKVAAPDGAPSLYDLLACIVDGAPPVLPNQPEMFSAEFIDFVAVCCTHDSKARKTQADLLVSAPAHACFVSPRLCAIPCRASLGAGVLPETGSLQHWAAWRSTANARPRVVPWPVSVAEPPVALRGARRT